MRSVRYYIIWRTTKNTHRDDAPQLFGAAHQRRAHALVADQIDRTAHVDVDEVHLTEKRDRKAFVFCCIPHHGGQDTQQQPGNRHNEGLTGHRIQQLRLYVCHKHKAVLGMS